MKQVIIPMAMLCAFAAACNKSAVMQSPQGTNPTSNLMSDNMDDEVKYDAIIETVGYGLLDLSDNETFRQIVAREAGKQFDGDDNVLLKNLSTACRDAGIDLAAAMNASLQRNGHPELSIYVSEAIDGFAYFGTKLYPQVYIPFITNRDINQLPAIALNHDDNETTLNSISYNSNGTPQQSTATAGTAQQQLTWVISVNETVDASGNVPLGGTPQSMGAPYPSGTKSTWFALQRVKISDPKESWFNGKSEISVVFKKLSNTNTTQYFNDVVKIFKTSNWNTWIGYTSGPGIQYNTLDNTYNGTIANTDRFAFIVYEKDIRNKFGRTEALIPGYSATNVDFCSKESKYGTLVRNPVSWYPNVTVELETISSGLTGIEIELKKQKITF
jgi:hypothetical protein